MKKILTRGMQRKIIITAVVSFLISIILQLVSLLPVSLMPKVIDVYIPARDYTSILISALIFCGIPVVLTMGYSMYQYYLMLKSRQIVAEVNLKCFDKILHQPMAFFDENHSTELAQKASQDVVSYVALWTIDFPKLISNIFIGIIVFVFLCRINIYIAVFQVLYIPVSLLLAKLVGKRLETLIEKVLEFNAKYNGQMQESFQSIRMVKANVLEQDACDRVKQVQNGILKIWGKVAFFDNFVGGISNTLVPGIFYGGSFVIAAIVALEGMISVGYLTGSVGYAAKIHGIFKDIIRVYSDFKKARGEMNVIEGYMELEDERDGNGKQKFGFKKSIELTDVTFKYPSMDQSILENMNLEIRKGEWIALSGASGVGKSTVLELLLRFYNIDGGTITVDGVPVERMDIYDIRNNISYVSQNPSLIQGTIRDNLLVVKPDATEEELEYVTKKTGIQTEIQGGLNKEVGEGGMLLSGGEKQRVAIARCILQQKSIWLLDEVTSQMDGKAQEIMIELLKEEHDRRGTTIISVAHRKEFCKYVDREIELLVPKMK